MHGVAMGPVSPGATPGAIAGVTPGVTRGAAPAPSSGRTMLGVAMGSLAAPTPTVQAPSQVPSQAPSQAPSQGVLLPSVTTSQRMRREQAPMMGGHAPGVPSATLPPGMLDPRSPTMAPYVPGPGDSLDFRVPGLPRRGRSGPWLAVSLLVLALILGGAAVAFVLRGRGEAPALPAQIRTAAQGTVIALTVPDAPAGTRLRYRGADYPVGANGTVEFPAGELPSEVGTVGLPVAIVRPNTPPEDRTAEVLIAWRVEPDLRHLGEDPARIHLVFHVPPGSSLAVAGQPIRVAGDTGIAEIPAPPPMPVTTLDPMRRDRFPIRVQTPSGAVVQGEYELRVPRATLRVDSPGPAALATNGTLAVRGRAPGATRVTIGGRPAALLAGAFSATVPVGPGNTPVDIVAYAPGAAPAVATVQAWRDITPQTYLGTGAQGAQGAQGASVVAASPPPEGARVRLDGRVLGNPVQDANGRTFQLMVEDRACHGGRCLVWIDPAAPVDVHDGDRVEVVGETHGVRAYTTQGGERRSDPVVIALFVLPVRR